MRQISPSSFSPPQAADCVDREGLARILNAAGAARHRRLTLEETYIFLAVGYFGLTKSRHGFAIQPTPCADIAALLHVPKDTVRRGAISLEILGLMVKNSKGVAIANVDAWLELALAFLSAQPPAMVKMSGG